MVLLALDGIAVPIARELGCHRCRPAVPMSVKIKFHNGKRYDGE